MQINGHFFSGEKVYLWFSFKLKTCYIVTGKGEKDLRKDFTWGEEGERQERKTWSYF